MARGRKAAPAEIQEARGNPGKRPTGEVPVAELPMLEGGVPSVLTKDGQKIWRSLVKQLGSIRMVRATDSAALERYCDNLAQYWAVTRRLRGQKLVYEATTTTGNKLLRVNPLFAVQERLERRLVPLEDRFGLTPRSRQEIIYRMAQAPSSAPELPLGDRPEDTEAPARGSAVGFLANDGSGSIH